RIRLTPGECRPRWARSSSRITTLIEMPLSRSSAQRRGRSSCRTALWLSWEEAIRTGLSLARLETLMRWIDRLGVPRAGPGQVYQQILQRSESDRKLLHRSGDQQHGTASWG